MERKGLSFEELEAQDTGLLPDRLEMTRGRRCCRGGVRVTQFTFVENNNTNVAIAEAEATGIEVNGDLDLF